MALGMTPSTLLSEPSNNGATNTPTTANRRSDRPPEVAASLPGGTFPRQASFHAFTARSRVLLIHMAEAWMRLAHQAEKNLTTVYETPHRVLAPVLQERPQQVQPKTNATWSPTVEGLNPQTWPAQIVQRQFAKLVGIAHACAGKLDNLVGYSFRDGIDFIHSEGCACPFRATPMARLVSGSNLKPCKNSVMGMTLSRFTGGLTWSALSTTP